MVDTMSVASSLATGPKPSNGRKRTRGSTNISGQLVTDAYHLNVQKPFQDITTTSGRQPTVAFMTCKEALKDSYKNMIAMFDHKHGTPTKLKAVVKALSANSTFQEDTNKPLAKLDQIKALMQAEMDQLETVQNNGEALLAARDHHHTFRDEANECMAVLQDLLAGAQMAKEKVSSESRVAKQAIRYQKNKVAWG